MIAFTSELPRSITIDGADYAINTDYRIMAEFERQIFICGNDRKKFARLIAETVVKLFIDKPPLGNYGKVIKAMMEYYRCGKPIKKNADTPKTIKRYYDYNEDSDYIYAAFKQQYGIDLVSADLHWWEFRALFMGLTDATEIVKIMQYRGTDVNKIKNKAEKVRIKKLQQRFALAEQNVRKFATLEERNAAFKQRIDERYKEVQEQLKNNK